MSGRARQLTVALPTRESQEGPTEEEAEVSVAPLDINLQCDVPSKLVLVPLSCKL